MKSGFHLSLMLSLIVTGSMFGAELAPNDTSVPAGIPSASPALATRDRQKNDPASAPASAPEAIAQAASAEPTRTSPDVQTLKTVTVNGDVAPVKIPKTPPEAPIQQFVRTGTLAEKKGKKVTSKFWIKGDRGVMMSFSW